MRIAVIGAGGVGGYYGVRLAQAGYEVCFAARGAQAEAIRQRGLVVESELGAAHLKPVRLLTETQGAGEVDLVLIAVKLWDTESAARAALPLIGAATTVVSLQNGIDKDEAIASLLGREHVLGGLTYINVVISAPGVITHSGKNQRIVLGELDGSLSARAEVIASAMRGAGIDAEATSSIRRAIWEKFVFLAAHSAATAVTRQPIGSLRNHPATRELLAEAMREGAALARAEGVDLEEDFTARRMAFFDSLDPASRASMAQDLLRGNRLELEWLSGAIVRRAERHGLATPVHRTLYAALVLYANGAPSPS